MRLIGWGAWSGKPTIGAALMFSREDWIGLLLILWRRCLSVGRFTVATEEEKCDD